MSTALAPLADETGLVTPTSLRANVAALTAASTPDEFAAARDAIDFIGEVYREALANWKAVALLRVDATGSGFNVGPHLRVWKGLDTDEKCQSVKETIGSLLTETAGDLDLICDCLSVNAFKPGKTRKTLSPEAYQKCFKTVITGKLKEEKLQEVDTRFLR